MSGLLGNGAGSVGTATNYPANSEPYGLGIGDFDGDPDPDVAVSNAYGGGFPGSVSILLTLDSCNVKMRHAGGGV